MWTCRSPERPPPIWQAGRRRARHGSDMTTSNSHIRVLLAISLLVGIGCDGDTPLMPSTTTPASEPVVTITSAGVTPSSITVSQGDRVLFVNNDTVAHEMSSDSHPTHGLWPAMNQVGFLLPGESARPGISTT